MIAKTLLTVLLISWATVEQSASALTATPVGVWDTISDTDGAPRAVIRIENDNGVLRGFVAGSLRSGEEHGKLCLKCFGSKHGKPILGMEVLWGLKPDRRNPLIYKDGGVLDPETGLQGQARMTMSQDGQTLKVQGYIGIPALGRTQTWRREAHDAAPNA